MNGLCPTRDIINLLCLWSHIQTDPIIYYPQSLTESKNGQMFERALKINTIFIVLTSGLHILHSTYQTSTEVSVREGKCCVSRQFRTSNQAHAFEKESTDRIFHVPTFINSEHLGSYYYCDLLSTVDKKDLQY